MTPITAAVIVFVIVDMIVGVVLVKYLARSVWRPLTTRWPAQDIAEDAVRRRFQSFRIGLVNLGWSIHVAVDERHLHLEPAGFWRRLGLERASIAWSAMEFVGTPGRRWATVRLGPHRIQGPAWCLELVDPDARTDSS